MTRCLLRLAAGVWIALAVALPTARAAAQAIREERSPETNPWSLRLAAELGVAGRDVDVPSDGIVYKVRPGLFPVFGLGFELDHAISDRFSLGLLVRYQSSFDHPVVERHTDGSQHPLDLRSQRLELALAPSVRLDASGTWTLFAATGYAFHNLRPEVHHLMTPAYSLAGPHLRAGLRLAPWGALVRLSVAPEAQWIVHAGEELAIRGIASRGVGVGGEAAVELVLGRHWAVRVAYREMRFWLDSTQTQRFEDVARFITARLSGTL